MVLVKTTTKTSKLNNKVVKTEKIKKKRENNVHKKSFGTTVLLHLIFRQYVNSYLSKYDRCETVERDLQCNMQWFFYGW